jgi:hypothetical protein
MILHCLKQKFINPGWDELPDVSGRTGSFPQVARLCNNDHLYMCSSLLSAVAVFHGTIKPHLFYGRRVNVPVATVTGEFGTNVTRH